MHVLRIKTRNGGQEIALHRTVWLALVLMAVLSSAISTPAQARQATQPSAAQAYEPFALSPEYKAVQERLARGWNTWDVNSVTTQVLLPEGLAVHLGLKHNTTEGGDALLTDALIGRLSPGAEQVFPGPHAWDGSYTDLRVSWNGHRWRVQSAHVGEDLVLLATPLASETKEALAPTIIFSVNLLWNRDGTVSRTGHVITAQLGPRTIDLYCTCFQANVAAPSRPITNISPISSPYFAVDFTKPVAISSGRPRTLAEVQAALDRSRNQYEQSLL